jgi:hypothetical protein
MLNASVILPANHMLANNWRHVASPVSNIGSPLVLYFCISLAARSSSIDVEARVDTVRRVLPQAELLASRNTAFVLHLLPQSFSINNQTIAHQYNTKTRALLDAIDSGRLPPDVLDMLVDIACPFYAGAVVVELHDYRGLLPANIDRSQPIAVPPTPAYPFFYIICFCF